MLHKKSVSVSKVNSICYKGSIKFSSTKTWNYLQNTLNIIFLEISRAKAKKPISKHFIDTYMDTGSLSEINIIQTSLTINARYVYIIFILFYFIFALSLFLSSLPFPALAKTLFSLSNNKFY